MPYIDNLTFEQACQVFKYDKVSGNIECPGTGKILGRLRSDGYITLHIKGNRYELAHRLCFLLKSGNYPLEEVDHIDGNKANNSWTNLREVSRSKNQWNSKKRSDNTSGIKGISWVEREQRWVARIQKEGNRICIGYFKTLPKATAAIELAREKLHKGFANHG